MVIGLAMLLLASCAAEKGDSPAVQTTAAAPGVAVSESQASTQSAPEENAETGTWAGQLKVSDPVSTFNYVGSESGDWVPMRFRNDSEAGRKILAACANDDRCEFTGAVEFLDEAPPPDASAVGQIVRVDSVKRLPAEAPGEAQ